MDGNDPPQTLLEAVKFFADPDVSLAFVASLRWADGVTCSHCQEGAPLFLKTRRIWKCRTCRKQFSAKVDTIFEDSPIPLEKWLPTLWLVVNCKSGVSSYEVARSLVVTQKTAWFMTHRIRMAMQTEIFNKVGGEVEVDEVFIGGRAAEMIKGTGSMKKAAVMGLVGRHGHDGEGHLPLAPRLCRTFAAHLQGADRGHERNRHFMEKLSAQDENAADDTEPDRDADWQRFLGDARRVLSIPKSEVDFMERTRRRKDRPSPRSGGSSRDT